VIGSLETLIGAALLIGFLTPIAGAFASLVNLAIGVSWLLTAGNHAYDRIVAPFYLLIISIAAKSSFLKPHGHHFHKNFKHSLPFQSTLHCSMRRQEIRTTLSLASRERVDRRQCIGDSFPGRVGVGGSTNVPRA
jgi:hypothetical protein